MSDIVKCSNHEMIDLYKLYSIYDSKNEFVTELIKKGIIENEAIIIWKAFDTASSLIFDYYNRNGNIMVRVRKEMENV